MGVTAAAQPLPGLDFAVRAHRASAWVGTGRSATNRWWVAVLDAGAATAVRLDGDELGGLVGALARTDPDPATILRRAREELAGRAGPGSRAVVAGIELDLCGAWVTVANAGPMRPIVVRRAGWTDLRGHESPPLGEPAREADEVEDDRAGLGPGDALVVACPGPAGPGGAGPDGDPPVEDLVEGALATAGRPAGEVADRVVAGARAFCPVTVVQVPTELGDDPRLRVARATGVDADRLDLPGYPLGDLQPDLWDRPPAPPREAHLRIAPDVLRLPEVRSLLRRLLASWRLEDRVAAHDVELLATEVLTNAIRHARSAATVVVRYTGAVVRIEVVDDDPGTLPELLPLDVEREGGRGVFLVEQMSSSWGVAPTGSGKRVWFEVPVAPAP
jgi:anti-sigma regulatory factor (Ser/Thr protein kinase)